MRILHFIEKARKRQPTNRMPVNTTDLAYRKLIPRIKQLREGKKLTQADLAALMGRPQSYVSRVERFQASLGLTEFVQWLRALGASPTEIFEEFAGDVPRKRYRVPLNKE